MHRNFSAIAAALVVAAFAITPARAEHLTGTCMLVAQAGAGHARKLAEGPALDAAISANPIRIFAIPPGYKPLTVICTRDEMLLAPNDFKVLALGQTLTIHVASEIGTDRYAVLELQQGRLAFTAAPGTDLTPDEIQVNSQLLDAMQKQAAAYFAAHPAN